MAARTKGPTTNALTETDLEDLAYDVERARQLVDLKVHDELREQRQFQEQNPRVVPWPETTCLELAEGILSEVVGRLQQAREVS